MFDIGFFELMIIMAIAVVVIGPQNLPKLAKAIGKGWGEFQSTFSGLKQEVMDEAESLKQNVNIDGLEQEVVSATKVDVDVNLDISDKGLEIANEVKNSSDKS
ncbi:MAG: twin-arginine translocase TatA/TatE family subunit [Nitrospinaceae bacterium]